MMSCGGNATTAEVANDSTVVDTIEVVDSTLVDTVSVD